VLTVQLSPQLVVGRAKVYTPLVEAPIASSTFVTNAVLSLVLHAGTAI